MSSFWLNLSLDKRLIKPFNNALSVFLDRLFLF
ncbi:hypothetical protein HP2RS_06009 [Helicobacter pylori]|nr:hypothetical protein HP2RS_06009 [Helicobacter pylori]